MNERAAISAYFHSIDRGDVIAFGPRQAGFTQDEGHAAAREIARHRGVDSPVWVFWHQQSSWVFDSTGNLVAPLLIHWGGDHDRVAELLAGLPSPLRVSDNGVHGAFAISSDLLEERRHSAFPDVSDTRAVKDRIRSITAQRRTDTEWTEAEINWMNTVLVHGDRAAQGYVVRWLAGSERISEEAYETLVGDWKSIYVKAPKDALVWNFLRTMNRRNDPRLDEVIDACMERPRYTFSFGVAYFLAERGDVADLPRLRRLALTPGKYPHTPGNRAALKGWVKLRAQQASQPMSAIAREALDDPEFDVAAVKELGRIAGSGR